MYEGLWRGNMFNGRGTLTQADGTQYIGEFEKGRRETVCGNFSGFCGLQRSLGNGFWICWQSKVEKIEAEDEVWSIKGEDPDNKIEEIFS